MWPEASAERIGQEWAKGTGEEATVMRLKYLPLISASEMVSEGVFEHLAGTVGQRAYEPGTPRAPPAAYGILR